MAQRPTAHKGRDALSNPAGRFETEHHEVFDDGWGSAEETPAAPTTELRTGPVRRIITRNDSPDLPFEASINPYKGCEHGCPYCFARPSHSYLNLSPGLDFETRIFFKDNAAERLEAELRKPGYIPTPIALGMNTDAYQPAECRLQVTRSLLEVLWAYRHPVSLVTKSTLITRDIDILTSMAEQGLVSAALPITTLDPATKHSLEPRTASPAARLKTLRSLTEAGIPTNVMVAPVIPAITDHELEAILESSAEHGATGAGYVLLRLPWEVKDIFREWLQSHYPDRADHVMSLVRQSRGGKDYGAAWDKRLIGIGVFAELIGQHFRLARRRYHLNSKPPPELDVSQFHWPPRAGDQLGLS